MAATIAKLNSKKAKEYYYEKDPLFNGDGKGENLEWAGLQAEFLGLKGAVDKKEFANLLEGKNKEGTLNLKETKNKIAAFDLSLIHI
jgi:conjugative relaxase-like TrwC/TraI family protein